MIDSITDKIKIGNSEYLGFIITSPTVFKNTGKFEERALNIERGEWHPEYRIFHSSFTNQG